MVLSLSMRVLWVLTQAVNRQATKNSHREWQYHMLHVYNCILLKMCTWGSKHIEENIILWINNNWCIKLVINIQPRTKASCLPATSSTWRYARDIEMHTIYYVQTTVIGTECTRIWAQILVPWNVSVRKAKHVWLWRGIWVYLCLVKCTYLRRAMPTYWKKRK